MAQTDAPAMFPEDVSERARLVRDVVASRTFSKSTRLCELLTYICGVTLEGRASELNEQRIGTQVFRRSASYNASDDSIVRSQARLLRQKLEEYFEYESPHTSEIITIPKGGYVPVFRPREAAARPDAHAARTAAPVPPATSAQSAQSTANILPAAEPPADIVRPHRSHWALLTSAAVGVALLVVMAWIIAQRAPPGDPSAANLLWRGIFQKHQPTLIVASDDGLVLFQELTHTSVSLSDYMDGSYLHRYTQSPSGGVTFDPAWFAAHQYTSTVDLHLTLQLSQLPEAALAQVEVRDARSLPLEDLKTQNVILIGGPGSNPLVGLFADRLNFQLGWDWTSGEGFVRNTHPEPAEMALYHDALLGSTRKSYGLVAYLPGISGRQNALLVEGTGMAGTQAAGDFLFGTAFNGFARSLGATPDRLPFFELLLETASLGGQAPQAHIVAYRLIRP